MNRQLVIIEGHSVIQDDPEEGEACGRVLFTASGGIDADGGYRAYHPDNKSGLDDLRNAGGLGNWCRPIVQGPDDPAPGFYVSATAYQWPGRAPSDPLRYVDAETVPYVVVSPLIRNAAKGIVLGCQARISSRWHASLEARGTAIWSYFPLHHYIFAIKAVLD